MKAIVDTSDGKRATFQVTEDDVRYWLQQRVVTVGEIGHGFVAIPFDTITRIDVWAVPPEAA